MGAKYTLHPAAFQEEVLNAEWMVAEMRARAEAGKAFAESIAPVDTGEYVASLAVDAGKHGGIRHDRAYAVLSASSDHAAEVEWGNGKGWHGAHVMTRSIDAMR
jgi:hypothetical protein